MLLWRSLALPLFVFVSVLVSMLGAHPVAAMSFQAPLDEARWEMSGDRFGCRLSQNIPAYGRAVLARRAGERQRFYLQEIIPRMRSGKASLVAVTPSWRSQVGGKDLGLIAVSQGHTPLTLSERLSQQVVDQLHQGMTVVATRKPWYGDKRDPSLRVAVSPVRFEQGYQRYAQCLSGLLPVNFDQVVRNTLLFGGGGQELPRRALRQLDNIVTYAKADDSVSVFYVDGHTDSSGAMAENLELSKQRAQMVVDYLTNAGIAADKIVMRWHGERYPVASNRSVKGRAQNRRVTVRLNRQEAPDVPESVSRRQGAESGSNS